MSEVTVKQLDELVGQLKELELEKEKQEEALKELNKKIAQLEGRCVQYLKDLEREDYDSPHGKLAIKPKWRVNLPQGDLNKKEFFEYLRQEGIFDKMATVNSNSLNSLYMSSWEDAKKRGEGMTFAMPGIDSPKLFEALTFKIKK